MLSHHKSLRAFGLYKLLILV